MKFSRRKNDTSTIRTIQSDDKTETYGIMGTVADLLKSNIMSYCNNPGDWWAFIDVTGIATFFQDKDALLKYVEDMNQ